MAAGCLLPELGDFAGSGSGSSDAAVTNDAGPPGSDAGAPDARSCPDGSFCDDFDDGPVGAKWGTKQEIDGLLSLVDAGVSKPNALQMEFLPPTTTERRAYLAKSFSLTAHTHVVCSVRVNPLVRTTGSGQDYQLLLLSERGTGYGSVYVKLTPTATDLIEEHPGDGGAARNLKFLTTATGGIATGSWSTLVLDVSYTNAIATLTVTGTTTTSITIPLVPPAKPTAIDVSLGDDGDTDTDVSRTLFDDLVCSFP